MMAKKCVAGHERCTGSGSMCGITLERAQEIRADALSGRNWAEEEAASSNSPSGPYGPTCLCGAGRRTLEAAFALKGAYGLPTGLCDRHRGGTVFRDSDRGK